MDVLQLLKEDHANILSQAGDLSEATTKKKVVELFPVFDQTLRSHVHLESGYLYPEIDELFADKDILGASAKRHKDILRHLDKLKKTIDSKKFEVSSLRPAIIGLAKLVELHVASSESLIIPRMRRFIATSEREDLAMVFLDAKQEPFFPPAAKSKGSKLKANRARA